MWTVELYRIDVESESYERVAVIENYRQLSFVDVKNNAGRGLLSLEIFDQNARKEKLIPYRTQVVLKKDGSCRFAGFVSNVSFSMRNVRGEVRIEFMGYFAHLSSRFTSAYQPYIQEDAGDIAWSLISTTQSKTNGWLGFYEGTIETTQDRDRYYEYKNIADAIVDLTNVINGFDFDLGIRTDSNDLFDGVTFNVYANSSTTRTYTLELGENVNVADGMQDTIIINDVQGIGAGTGDDVLTATDSDANSQVGYTRREYIYNRADISEYDTLLTHTQNIVDDRSVEKYRYQLEMIPGRKPVYGSINLGDRVNIKLKTTEDSYLNVERTAVIHEIRVDVDELGVEKVTYTVKT